MKMKILLCMSLLAVSCLCGCRQKEKVSFSETYDTESISSINMQIDSWQLKIMASSDEDVHISLDGGTEKGAKTPSVEVQDGMRDIMQIDGEGSAVGRFSLGKEGEVIVYIPVALKGAVTIKNGSGDIGVSYKTQQQNLSFKISSGSDDVTVRLDGVSYTTETSACKQGKIGSGGYSLTLNGDSGTVVIH